MLLSSFLWPVWARAHARTAKEREQMAQRYTNEVVRLSMYGTMRPEKYPELAAHLARIATAKPARKSVKKPAKPAAQKAVQKPPAGKSRSKCKTSRRPPTGQRPPPHPHGHGAFARTCTVQ